MTIQELLSLLQRYRAMQSQPNTAAARNHPAQMTRSNRGAVGQSMRPGDAASNSAYGPQQWQMLQQMRQGFLNPGGGMLGRDVNGLGQMGQYGWGGFQRNGQPVGNIGWLQGGDPTQGNRGSVMTGPPSWGAQNWLQDLLNMSGQNAMPYHNQYDNQTVGQNALGGLLANSEGAQFHGGGAGMIDFLNRGNDMNSMDQSFRGLGADSSAGGGIGGGFNMLA